ncbi:hypothetical protein [Deinococcus budaensis]|uniref:Chromosome segregation ATPase n=1 Tax=Deinococcus budaensis TaxID=1665626 RepID=A0A7W8GF28_9DEIO|nr:hypothetical protein [Deinococcus budaensis]MBB5234467.1 chromosome segregation ATPase [Deinococcus budaensis]
MTKLLTLVLALPYFDGVTWHRDVGQSFDTSKLDAKVVEKLQTKGFLMTAAAYKARTNPEAAEVQATADATAEQLVAARERVTELEGQLQTANSSLTTRTSELTEAQRKVTSLGEQVGSLTTQLGEATRKAQAVEEDVQALAQYREVVGPLLPTTELQPRAHKSLLTHGYYTVKLVQAATDEKLKALPEVGDTTVETLRRLYPAQG